MCECHLLVFLTRFPAQHLEAANGRPFDEEKKKDSGDLPNDK